MGFTADQILRKATACVKMGYIRLAVCIDGNKHPFPFRFPLKNTLFIGKHHRTESTIIKRHRFPLCLCQLTDPLGQLVKLRLPKACPENLVPILLLPFGSPLASIINTGYARHPKAHGINQRQVLFIAKDTCHPGNIMVIHKGKHMLAFIKGPVLRAELTQQGMDDLKHVHTVKAGKQPLVAFIVGSRVEHGIIHQAVVVPVKHFPQKVKLRFQLLGEAAEPAQEILVQAVRHIQAQPVNIKLVHPIFHRVQQMVHHFPVLKVQLHQVVMAFPSLIPKPVIVIGITVQADTEPVQVRRTLPVADHILKLVKTPSHMIEHPVQHHFDPVFMKLFANLPEIIVRAKAGINLLIISRIISMGIRFKYR